MPQLSITQVGVRAKPRIIERSNFDDVRWHGWPRVRLRRHAGLLARMPRRPLADVLGSGGSQRRSFPRIPPPSATTSRTYGFRARRAFTPPRTRPSERVRDRPRATTVRHPTRMTPPPCLAQRPTKSDCLGVYHTLRAPPQRSRRLGCRLPRVSTSVTLDMTPRHHHFCSFAPG